MKQIKRFTVWALLLATVLAFAPFGVHAAISTTATGYTDAEDVQYLTVSGTVVNWGARDEDCTFLTTYAESYYSGSYSWTTLSQKDGGTGTSDAYTSELYLTLQAMMKAKHTKIQGYQDTRQYYQYTDCVSNDYTLISSFYSGKTVASKWTGSTYNREHIWPKSKCIHTDKTNDSADIMMLRATISSENSSRGNTAYGESSGYYNPGADVRGDCARMVLYGYVRWGNTGKMWGSSGVIESLDVLLKWMEEDPVDTWEMGRNDSVQSITGVRNVFVDYPEYAWLLFGRDVPEDMTTPSGSGEADTHNHSFNQKITAPTCTEQGYTTFYCWCGESENRNFVDATGHSYGDWSEVTASTCTEQGQQRRNCTNCNHFETQPTAALEHNYASNVVAPTCTEQGYTSYTCSRCGSSYTEDSVDANGHSYGDWFEVTASTCTAQGQQRRNCANCDHFETQPTAALEHNYASNIVVPTCTEQGYTTYTCSTCGKTYTADYIDATGHSFGEWITVPGGGSQSRWCSVCDYEEIEDLSDCLHTNTILSDAADATCAEPGFSGRLYCNDCSVFLDMGQEIPATGHTDADQNLLCDSCGTDLCAHTQVEVRDALNVTCTVDGYTGNTYCQICEKCTATGVAIPATGEHNFTDWAADEAGKTNVRTCQECGLTETEEITCLHQTYTRKDEIQPTCSKVGFTGDIYCGDCGIFLYKGAVIAAVGSHTFGEWVRKDLTASRTCQECGYTESAPISDPEVPQEEADPLTVVAAIAVLGGGAAVLWILKRKKK